MALTESLKSQIQGHYRDWLKNNNCKPRRPQREMIAHIARCLGSVEIDGEGFRQDSFQDQLCIVQAGTGTGKTLAYLVSAICIAKELDKKVVISTATVALQEQLLNKDLPNLNQTTSMQFSYAIAKGRSRYLCLSKMQMRLSEISGDAQPQGLFPDEQSTLSNSAKGSIRSLSNAVEQKQWDGDIDLVPVDFDLDDWSLVSADRNSCSGKQCSNYRSCYLFNARDEVRKSEVIVANHDLVLADLAQGGGNVLPAPEETIYIFDEGHHLPEKSRNHLSSTISIDAQIKQLDVTQKIFSQLKQVKAVSGHVLDKELDMLHLDEAAASILKVLSDELLALISDSMENESLLDVNAEEGIYRFRNGLVADSTASQFADLERCLVEKQRHLVSLHTALSELLTDTDKLESTSETLGGSDQAKQRLENIYGNIGQLLERVDNALSVCESYAVAGEVNQKEPYARWLALADTSGGATLDVHVHSVPLSTAAILRRILWSKCFAAIVTSATLAPAGRLNHIYEKLGQGNDRSSILLLGEFNYPGTVFSVPKMQSQPNQVSLHTEEVAELIPCLLSEAAGSLVLFSSRRQMEDVAELLSEEGLDILVQGTRSKQALIQLHKERIDEDQQSVLFGLASFAEGLDLPGDYCKTVIISKLPFAVPDGPVDKALSEWIESRGGNSFRDISLPDAAVKLMQATGRLLRKEDDSGSICLLDRRVVEKSYGKQLLASLPPFTFELN